MGIAVDQIDARTALALLEWQVECGVTDALEDAPVDRYALPVSTARVDARAAVVADCPAPAPSTIMPSAPSADPVAEAEALAARAGTLEELAALQSAFAHCELKNGARSFVFADGNPQARVMIVGEAPGREEDIAGKPFVGAAGQLLDRMFAAIGLSRTSPAPENALYITNILPWRPPGNRDPEPAEMAMMKPFVLRHIALIDPDLLVFMGNTPCAALLGTRGILKLRGNWRQAAGIDAMPMTHPAYLLRNPIAKREAWADLLAIRARLDTARGGA